MEMVEEGEVSEIVIAHKDLGAFRIRVLREVLCGSWVQDHRDECRIALSRGRTSKGSFQHRAVLSSRLYGLRRYKKADIVAMVNP
jgi:predicted site-specific integrase-resolvase